MFFKILCHALIIGQLLSPAAKADWIDDVFGGKDKDPIYAEGLKDGKAAGEKEAQERAPQEAQKKGALDGQTKGVEECKKQEQDAATKKGYTEGYEAGTRAATEAAKIQAQIDADRNAEIEGTTVGRQNAEAKAKDAATNMGKQRGDSEADLSDAKSSGWDMGYAEGEAEAISKAKAQEYPRGRKEYQQERLSVAPSNQIEISQLPAQNSSSTLLKSFARILDNTGNGTEPDKRYLNPTKTFEKSSQTRTYKSGYEKGYNAGFKAEYEMLYKDNYGQTFDQAKEEGCEAARNADYSKEFQEGIKNGVNQGYYASYSATYQSEYKESFTSKKEAVAKEIEKQSYATFYQKYFEIARRETYSTEYKRIFEQSKAQGKQKAYDEKYNALAEESYKQGRADEETEFELKPLRLLSVEPMESISNGIFEPEENIRLRMQVRNFANQNIAKDDVELRLLSDDADAVTINQVSQNLSADLGPNSLNTLTNALEFKVNASATNRDISLKAQLTYKGLIVGEQDFTINAKWLVKIDALDTSELKTGIPSTIKLKLFNQSHTHTISGATLLLSSDPTALEVTSNRLKINQLGPQREATIEVPVIVRNDDKNLSFTAIIMSEKGQRISLFAFSKEIKTSDVVDLKVKSKLSALKQTGKQKLEISITNLQSRETLKGLNVEIRFLGENRDAFSVLGSNSQEIETLSGSRSKNLSFSIEVATPNQSGTMEIEIRQADKRLLLQRVNF